MAPRGRPKKDPSLALKHPIHVRVTADELARVAADFRAAQVPSRSQYLRALLTGRHLRTRTDQETLRALSRIGNNLNQIARHLNSGTLTSTTDLRSELSALQAEVLRIASRL
jgi:cytochrome c